VNTEVPGQRWSRNLKTVDVVTCCLGAVANNYGVRVEWWLSGLNRRNSDRNLLSNTTSFTTHEVTWDWTHTPGEKRACDFPSHNPASKPYIMSVNCLQMAGHVSFTDLPDTKRNPDRMGQWFYATYLVRSSEGKPQHQVEWVVILRSDSLNSHRSIHWYHLDIMSIVVVAVKGKSRCLRRNLNLGCPAHNQSLALSCCICNRKWRWFTRIDCMYSTQ
jgi:hypothetical protein